MTNFALSSDNSHNGQDSATSPIQLSICTMVMGFFSSLWILYHHHEYREQVALCYLSITLVFTWLLDYLLLATGVAT
ncbi:MAG: hypothetical protein ACREPR_13135 [Brasilonema sp.]